VFREPLRAEALAGLAFKTIDLALADERLEAFFDAFGFTFALVAMDVRNLYGLCPLKSRHPLATNLQVSRRTYWRRGIPTAAGRPSSGDFLGSISIT